MTPRSAPGHQSKVAFRQWQGKKCTTNQYRRSNRTLYVRIRAVVREFEGNFVPCCALLAVHTHSAAAARGGLSCGSTSSRPARPANSWHTQPVSGHPVDVLFAGSNNTNSRAYQQAWQDLVEHAPVYRNMDKRRAQSLYRWPRRGSGVGVVEAAAPTNVRLNLNHPRSARRKYEASFAPPKPDGRGGDTASVKLQDQIADLQQKLDAALSMKTSGAIPAGMKVEDFVQTIQDGMVDDTWRRFAAAVAKRHEAMGRQSMSGTGS
jgi:hypothetical protein